jgi:hypothetical protein
MAAMQADQPSAPRTGFFSAGVHLPAGAFFPVAVPANVAVIDSGIEIEMNRVQGNCNCNCIFNARFTVLPKLFNRNEDLDCATAGRRRIAGIPFGLKIRNIRSKLGHEGIGGVVHLGKVVFELGQVSSDFVWQAGRRRKR